MFTDARKKMGNGLTAGCQLFYRIIYGYFCSVLCLCSTFLCCFCPFSPALLLRLLHQRRRLHTKLLCSQRTFGNYWAFAVFRGPDLIANLSDGLKIIDQGFITCDDIGKLGPVVQSIVSLTSSLRGQLVKCFMTL